MNAVLPATDSRNRGFGRFADTRPVGDVIPFFDHGVHHLFILTPPEGSLHHPERLTTTWRHITSADLVNWEELPDALAPGTAGSIDSGGIWTGSVLRVGDDFHLYYTGHATSQQTVCHATSRDGIHWTKDPHNPISRPEPGVFEENDWRDPFVFLNEEEGRYWMLITSRSSGVSAPTRGVIACSTSADLAEWTRPEVLYRTFLTHAPECPEIFKLDGRWVLGYSRFTDRRGTVYRVSDSIRGPWRTFGEDGPDAANWYAAKGLSDADGRRISFGWVPDHDPGPADPANPWLWAGDLALPRELRVSPAGVVTTNLPDEVRTQFGEELATAVSTVQGEWAAIDGGSAVSAAGEVALQLLRAPGPTSRSVLSATFDGLADAYQVGVLVHTSEMLDRGVGIFYYPRTASIRAVDMTAPIGKVTAEYETMFGQYAPIAVHDLTGPLAGPVEFTVVVRGDVVEAFVGGVCCLTFRTRETASTHAALVAVDSVCTVRSVSWRTFA